MSSDIDIEEHDLLDHPRIRQIFPDISSLKTEVEEIYQEEGIDIEEDYTYYKPDHIIIKEEYSPKQFTNKIIIGSKPCTSSSLSQGLAYQELNSQEPESLEASLEEPGLQRASLEQAEIQETSLEQAKIQETSFEGSEIRERSLEENVFDVSSESSKVMPQDVPDTSILKLLLQEQWFPNKIILGTKTVSSSSSYNESDQEDFDPKVELETYVLLKDCAAFLQNNPCFCRECKVLFPTSSGLDAHKMMSHPLLVAVSRNKAVKSTSKSSIRKSLVCNHCNVLFPDTLALLKHTYELLPGKTTEALFSCDECDAVYDNEADCKAHKFEIHKEKVPTRLFVVCKICSCHFKTLHRLGGHMQKCHNMTQIEAVESVEPNFQCPFCNSKSASQKAYNVHIYKFHKKIYAGSNFKNVPKFQCPQCNMCFSSVYSVRIHLAAKHGYLGSYEDSKKIVNSLKNPFENKNLPTVSKIPPKPVKCKKYPLNTTKTRPVPKSTLFKCNKCHLHFVTCVNAVIHSRLCVPKSKKGNFACQQCRRTLKIQDKFYHNYQHSISEKFKVFEISRNILNRILCKCKTCGVCFDENSFMALHTNSCNADTTSVQCKECNLWIHSKAISVHRKIHKNGLTPRDFIVTEYVHAVMPLKDSTKLETVEKIKEETEKIMNVNPKHTIVNKFKEETRNAIKISPKHSLVKNIVRRYKKKWYYYCPTCKCYMRANKLCDKHYIGQCNTKIHRMTCKLCGLKFTDKCLKSHRETHKMYPKLKLKDLKFINIQNGELVNPPTPDFKKCKICQVAFFSVAALRCHTCHAEESKTCFYCKEKFSDMAYKLHVPFHEYAAKNIEHVDQVTKNENIPELIKKYKSLKQVWNILYLCQFCDVIIDTYDKVVEHCQDHFSNMQSYNVTIEHCDLCDLKFMDDCFERHKKLHLNTDNMDKDSFIILEYKYENLLTDKWMDMFDNLTKEQIQLVLSKSMYKFTRCARMKLVSTGSYDLTLYKCSECKLIVAPNKVMEHSQNLNQICEDAKTFPCSICTLKFAYKTQRVVHENLHELRKLNAKSFRIVEFQADKHLFSVTEVNDEADKKNNDFEDLKFIRCQHCGKLINKQKYKSHMQSHENYKNKIKYKPVKQTFNKGVNKMKQIKPINNKILNFYVCKDCKICVAKESIKLHQHVCDPNIKKKKCDICFLLFRSQNLAAHYKSHEIKNFTRSNMKVMYFEGEVIYKKPISKPFFEGKRFNEKTLTLYQCAKCGICIWNKINIVRHGCTPPGRQYKCELCGFAFRACSQTSHREMHEHRQIDKNSVTILKFNGTNIFKPKFSNPVSHKRKITNSEIVDTKRPKILNNELRTYVKKRKFVTNDQEPFAKKIKTEYRSKISVEEFVLHTTNRYYKCQTCKLLFVRLPDLISHEDSCVTHRDAVKCFKCRLIFHASNIAKHISTQACNLQTEDSVFMITIQQKGIAHDKDSNWIVFCVNCEIYNISPRGFQYHLKNGHQIKYTIQTCEICDIKFTSTSYKNHLKMHHGDKEINISDLSIARVEETTLAKALEDLPDNKDVVYIDYKTALEVLPLEKKENNPIQTCDICGLSFIHPRTLKKHKDINRHNEYRESCDICGSAFTTYSLKKHMIMHHGATGTDKNYTANIDTQSESVSYESQSIPSLDQGDGDMSDIISVSKDDEYDENIHPIETTSDFDKPIKDNETLDIKAKTYTDKELFNCDVCNINFMCESSLVRHKRVDKHNEAHHTCTECGLIFSFISLKKHLEVHHNIIAHIKRFGIKKSKNDLNDSVLESVSQVFEENKPCTSFSISNNTENDALDKNSEKENLNAAEDAVKTTGNIENNANTVLLNDMTTSRSIDDIPNIVTNENNTRTETLNKNKLFKCNICNVYFLTSIDCSNHMTNHVQLDTYEYIACKMCNLQFCCEFLGRHMKTHREKSFSTDDLIVAEYFLEREDVTIDTYLFLDRLKIKQVTTTSNLDNEMVDSTTSENIESEPSNDVTS